MDWGIEKKRTSKKRLTTRLSLSSLVVRGAGARVLRVGPRVSWPWTTRIPTITISKLTIPYNDSMSTCKPCPVCLMVSKPCYR
jgi:hypothetical protein